MEQRIGRPVNLRDMGGQKTVDNKQVKYKRLLRSGEVCGLSAEERVLLAQDMQLRVLVDFRTPGEIAQSPDDAFEGVRYVPIDLFHGDEQQAANMNNFEETYTETGAWEFMHSAYDALANNEAAHRGFAELIRLARDNKEGALLFHCFAGKDRTGVAAAMLYTLLGVPKEAIVEEYMRSNQLRDEWSTRLISAARDAGATPEELKVLNIFYYARPEYLLRVYDVAEQSHGSLLAFVQDKLQVTDADVRELKENYLE